MSNMFWAAFGGAAAAGIFTLLAVLFAEWLRRFLDRPLLKVNMTFARIHNHPMFKEGVRYICLEAKNPHSKPVTVETFGFDYKSKTKERFQVLPDGLYQFPYEVKGGQSISQLTTEESLFPALRKEGKKPSDLKGVWFQSSPGQVFRGKIPRVSMRVLEEAFQAKAKGKK